VYDGKGTLEAEHTNCGENNKGKGEYEVKQLTQIGNKTDMQMGEGNRNGFSRRIRRCQGNKGVH